MITDADIKKLRSVFATKDDLVAMEKRQDEKFATKSDLGEIKIDLGQIKNDLGQMRKDIVSMEQRIRKDIVDDITGYMQDNVIPLLNEHEKRIDRLEKHAGGFPSVA